MKLKQAAQKDFTQKVRSLKSTDSREYWKLINIRQVGKVQANLEDVYEHFKELSENSTRLITRMETGMDTLGTLEQHFNITELYKPFDEAEIKKVPQKLKTNKSPCADMILNEYIKTSLDQLMPVYVHLFNRVLDTGDTWLIEKKLCSFAKGKGSALVLGNCRSLTLLSCMGELFTHLLNARLAQFTGRNKLLNGNQAVFIKAYGTVDYIFVSKCLIDLFCVNKRKLFYPFVN